MDDPNTPNAMVSYELLSIEPGIQIALNLMHWNDCIIKNKILLFTENVVIPLPDNYQNIFIIESYGGLYGRIKTTKSMKGYSGKWKLTIKVILELCTW